MAESEESHRSIGLSLLLRLEDFLPTELSQAAAALASRHELRLNSQIKCLWDLIFSDIGRWFILKTVMVSER